jgi:hypothetical protein
MDKKIKICIDHINEIFDTEDLCTEVDFGTFHVVSGSLTQPCDLVTGDDEEHLTEPLTSDFIYQLYRI